jgi:hypothetical protein
MTDQRTHDDLALRTANGSPVDSTDIVEHTVIKPPADFCRPVLVVMQTDQDRRAEMGVRWKRAAAEETTEEGDDGI